VTVSAVARRRAERARLIATVEEWAGALVDRLPGVDAVVVFGSVARGDFNRWSDIDVLVVAEQLPGDWREHDAAIGSTPPGVQVIAWTPDEYAARSQRGDPIAVEAAGDGVVVWGALPSL
jgi:uncharacterized protein